MIESHFDSVRRIRFNVAKRDLTMVDMMEASRGWFDDPAFSPEIPVVWNCVDAVVAISLDEIIRLDPRVVERVNEARGEGKTAWVVSSAIGESLVKIIYDQFGWQGNWRTFTNVEAAVAWCLR